MSGCLRGLIVATLTALGLTGSVGHAATPLDTVAGTVAGMKAGTEAAGRTQAQAFVEALRPRREGRPVIAVLASNEGTETTDFLLPHAVLARADVAEVQAVAVRTGPVTLHPALGIEVGQDLAGFDRSHPSGADYVIVPAMMDDDDPAITDWLRQQADKGARIIGICSGARVVGRAGLLDGRRFAGHWYDRSTLLKRHPGATHTPNQRYVIDRDVVTTTGITASLPVTLALVEALGGRAKAQALADEIGVASWGPDHDSAPFGLTASHAWNYLLTMVAVWNHERWRVEVPDGTDDIALALVVDAWSRTGRVEVEAVSASGPVRLRSGLTLRTDASVTQGRPLPLSPTLKPAAQLDRTLCEIAGRFGAERRAWVMQEMEYPERPRICAF